MTPKKTNATEMLSDDLRRGPVVFVTWTRQALIGRHYVPIGDHHCELNRDLHHRVLCFTPGPEGSFTRPGYSDEMQYSEGVVRERVARFWRLRNADAHAILHGQETPVTLIASVPEGESTIARFAFEINPEQPLVYYHGAGFGWVLGEQLDNHPALGHYVLPSKRAKNAEATQIKASAARIVREADVMQLAKV